MKALQASKIIFADNSTDTQTDPSENNDQKLPRGRSSLAQKFCIVFLNLPEAEIPSDLVRKTLSTFAADIFTSVS